MSNHNSSPKRRLYRFDPVAFLLIEKLNLSPLGFGLRSTAIAAGLYLLLRSLKDYSLKTAYLAAVLGIMVGLIEYQFITQGVGRVYWFVHLIIPLHVALSMACFFGPLLAAHKSMKNAKEKILNEIAQQFQEDYLQIHANQTKDAETFKKGTEKVKELRAFYTLTDEFPVWPFDVQTFRQYLLTVPTPLLPKLIGPLLKKWGIDLG
jgi:hypothetical protein